jgi:hypothetical protein
MYCIIFTKCTYNSTVTSISRCQKNLDFICGNPIWNVTWILWINNPEGTREAFSGLSRGHSDPRLLQPLLS